jgi:D-tyrosyl-tRNA(Tyr) deacylase
MAAKLWTLRLFDDADGRMGVGADEAGAELLVISQFTLYGDTRKGRRPSWTAAAPGAVAEPLVDEVVDELRRLGATVATGRFGAMMQVSLVNDGPTTVLVEI